MVEHELNGENDYCIMWCLELGEERDRWQVVMKNNSASGILTIFHVDCDGEKSFNGWEWAGSPSMVHADGTVTDDLQDVLDCLASEYA